MFHLIGDGVNWIAIHFRRVHWIAYFSNLNLKMFCFFLHRCDSGRSHLSSSQDGGAVAEDLCAAVQCGQDHAV